VAGSKLNGYMTLKELSGRLGNGTGAAAVQRLRRQLRAKEKRIGESFLVRLGSGANSPLYVTDAVIRQYCPELISGRDEVAEKFREYVRDLEERMVELRMRDRALAQRIVENKKALGEIRGYLDMGSCDSN